MTSRRPMPLTADARADRRPEPVPATRPRRVPTASPTVHEERQALARYIAADPIRIQWLRDHVAGVLDGIALAVAESDPPTVEVAAAAITSRADAHRRGATPLW